jgi:hypothetical protein
MKEITRLGVSPSPEACGITVDDGGKSGLAGRRAAGLILTERVLG